MLDTSRANAVEGRQNSERLQALLDTSRANEVEAIPNSERLQQRVDYLTNVGRSVIGTVRTTNIALEQRIRNHQRDVGTLLAGMVNDSLRFIEGRTVPDVDNMDPPTPEQRTGGTSRQELQIVYLIQDKVVDIAVPDHQPVILHTDRIEHNFTFKSNSCTCLLYTSPSPRDQRGSRMPSSA